MAVAVEERKIREAYIRRRDALSFHEVKVKSERISERFQDLEIYRKAKGVLFYHSKGTEVSTFRMMEVALKEGKKIALPRCVDESHMEAYIIKDPKKDCVKGCFGIMEPELRQTQKISRDALDVFVLPGVSFDLYGNRMGWGKGYFDRYLQGLKTTQIKVGLAYEIQLYPSWLDFKPHDVKMDILVTEDRVVYFKQE